MDDFYQDDIASGDDSSERVCYSDASPSDNK